MKDSHLTLRLPAELGRTLDRLAESRDLPKSQLVREAVAMYLAPAANVRGVEATLTARALARRWHAIPHLDAHDARALAADLRAARRTLAAPEPPWE